MHLEIKYITPPVLLSRIWISVGNEMALLIASQLTSAVSAVCAIGNQQSVQRCQTGCYSTIVTINIIIIKGSRTFFFFFFGIGIFLFLLFAMTVEKGATWES